MAEIDSSPRRLPRDTLNAVISQPLTLGLCPLSPLSAGTVPYAATAALTAYTARGASLIYEAGGTPSLDFLASLQTFQITYGAVILSFLGACHWGMEFAKLGGEQGHKR